MTKANQMIRARAGESLTLEEMRASLPSIFQSMPHESRSERYVYISTADMVERLMRGGFYPVEARASVSRDPARQPYVKHMLRFRGKGDLDRPDNSMLKANLGVAYEIIMRNAHDGSGSYQMLAGLIRFACENGLVVSDGTVAMLKVLHTGNRQRLADAVLASANTVLEQGPQVGEKIRRWQEIELAPQERSAFAKAAHRLRFGKESKTAISPEQLALPRRITDAGHSLWNVFNVVQENAVRGGLWAEGKDAHGRRHKYLAKTIRGIDQDLTVNRGLWALAERSAALKEAGRPALELEGENVVR